MTHDNIPQEPGQRRFSRGGVAAGLAAGLVGGSLAGLALGVPGISSATSDGIAAPAALVQQTDDTDTVPADPAPTEPAPDDTTTDDTAPAEIGDRLRDTLQELVDDGTLTAGQADAVTTHLIENRPERLNRGGHRDHGDRGGRRGHGGFDRSGVITDLLGIDAETLRDELRSGSTLAEIAEANGVETSALIDAIVAQAGERFDTAVENERLTAEEAAEKLAEFEAKVTERINGN